ncbi:heme-dependent oxidative N-demethylase family protein [Hellea balneolensis]|uniref:heme-dependent oxidative N-demethylase family protein n=1 Tax=Hellea balneolensis TaxID=287478 RepID=UPI00042605FF|nr:DUF3445 domain-containing protein [Hellea balneolensis]
MILNSYLPIKAWLDSRTARLPGVQPVAIDGWLVRSDTFEAQMTYRHELVTKRRETVFQAMDVATEACHELCNLLGEENADDHPLINAALIVQEDLCILQKQGDRHILTAAVMCFPSSWDLHQKIGRSISAIHEPVPEFSPVTKSVERMLSAIRVDQPLGRANFLIYTDPELHQPRGEGISKPIDPQAPRFIRVERQTFRRMPETGAVVFAIHTYVVPESSLTAEEHRVLARLKPELIRS